MRRKAEGRRAPGRGAQRKAQVPLGDQAGWTQVEVKVVEKEERESPEEGEGLREQHVWGLRGRTVPGNAQSIRKLMEGVGGQDRDNDQEGAEAQAARPQ